VKKSFGNCVATAMVVALLGPVPAGASDHGSRTSGSDSVCTSAAIIFIKLDRFAPQAYWSASGGEQILWKPYYWAAEGGDTGRFRITRDSDDCDDQRARAFYGADAVTATAGSDFSLPSAWSNQLEDRYHGTPGKYFQDVDVPISNDMQAEPVVEKAVVKLTNFDNANAGSPTQAPLYIVDNDATGFAFAEPTYTHSEFGPTMPVPIFRGGPAATSQTVNFTVEESGDNPAIEGENFTVSGPKSVTFGPGERVKVIDISVTNNLEADGDRSFNIALTGETQQNETEVTILDAGGDPPIGPNSRFHHPRHGWKYKLSDFRIREIHPFAFDNGGPEIEWAKFALRKKMSSGRCAWWNGTGFRGGKCSTKKWLQMKRFGDFNGKLLYTYNVKKRLDPTKGTRIKSYTGFTRVSNIAGTTETRLKRGRNVSNFKVTH
jgi:hypothetical protein